MAPQAPLDTVAVIGLGYIGLPTAAVLAQAGKQVIGVDVKQSSVDAINAGRVPFVEDGLEAVLAGVVAQGKLRAQLETPVADAYIISVPTPFTAEHEADLSYIEAAARGIAPQLSGGELIVLESTAPPGATERMADVILEARPEFTKDPNLPNSLYFSHAPERVLPGRIMIEMVENDRIIGGLTPEASEMNRDLYASFCSGELLLTDARTAEMAKLTENAFRDVNIAFANEIALIAAKQGIDAWELIALANHHPRVNILKPGPGVGGHCIAVDPWFIVAADRINSPLIQSARSVNDARPRHIADTIISKYNPGNDKPILIFGLSFKPNVDDTRGSPSIAVIEMLRRKLPKQPIIVIDPHVKNLPPELAAHDNIALQSDLKPTDDFQIVVFLVAHAAFREHAYVEFEGIPVIDACGAINKVSTEPLTPPMRQK